MRKIIMELILYHGTDLEIAKKIVATKFLYKSSPYHWLGNGIYFYTDKHLAKWWTTNPSKNFGVKVENPAIVKTTVQIDKNNILDLRDFETYHNIAEEFERFFTELYIPHHKETITESQIKCLFFDWYFLIHTDIKIIIGNFFSLNQPYFHENEKGFYSHTNLLYGETQVCLHENYQELIIDKEVIAI